MLSETYILSFFKKLAFHLKAIIVKDKKCQFPNMARIRVVTFRRSMPSSYIRTPGVRVGFIQEMAKEIFKLPDFISTGRYMGAHLRQ